MKKLVFLTMLMFSMISVAQDYYKVVIMPKKFDILKEENQYNLNVLCKSYFEKEGFEVFYSSDDLPIELVNNKCNALFLNLLDDSSMLKTKVKVELKDCQNNLILVSEEGETREKNLSKAYNEAIRIALISLTGKTNIKNTTNFVRSKPNKDSEIVEMNENSKLENTKTLNAFKKGLNISSTEKGFNIVDENNNIKFELLKTTNPTIYIAKKGSIQGIFTIYSKDNSEFEYYQNDVLVVEKVELKF